MSRYIASTVYSQYSMGYSIVRYELHHNILWQLQHTTHFVCTSSYCTLSNTYYKPHQSITIAVKIKLTGHIQGLVLFTQGDVQFCQHSDEPLPPTVDAAAIKSRALIMTLDRDQMYAQRRGLVVAAW